MSDFRRKYYDFFSNFYDKFIKIHSGDKQEKIRENFTDIVGISERSKVLDICCGTGSTMKYIRKKVGNNGIVIGADFSMGMLKKAKEKIPDGNFILCSVSNIPAKDNVFDRVTCTFAFYELKGEMLHQTLKEIRRVLTDKGKFFMMEHEVPRKPIIKFLFYVRMLSMGFKKAFNLLNNEQELFRKYFKNVRKIHSVSKNSKIWICGKN